MFVRINYNYYLYWHQYDFVTDGPIDKLLLTITSLTDDGASFVPQSDRKQQQILSPLICFSYC